MGREERSGLLSTKLSNLSLRPKPAGPGPKRPNAASRQEPSGAGAAFPTGHGEEGSVGALRPSAGIAGLSRAELPSDHTNTV